MSKTRFVERRHFVGRFAVSFFLLSAIGAWAQIGAGSITGIVTELALGKKREIKQTT